MFSRERSCFGFSPVWIAAEKKTWNAAIIRHPLPRARSMRRVAVVGSAAGMCHVLIDLIAIKKYLPAGSVRVPRHSLYLCVY